MLPVHFIEPWTSGKKCFAKSRGKNVRNISKPNSWGSIFLTEYCILKINLEQMKNSRVTQLV